MYKYTTEQLDFIQELRGKRKAWTTVAEEFNKKFNTDISWDCLRKFHKRNELTTELGSEDVDIKILTQTRNTKLTNTRLRRETNIILDSLSYQEVLLEKMKGLIESWKIKGLPKPSKKQLKKTKVKECILELLVSDLHIGLKTKDFDLDTVKRSIAEVKDRFIKEIKTSETRFNIKKLVIALLGDIIASFEFHGLESALTCESGAYTPVQTSNAIEILFYDLIYPIALTGYKIEIPCVPGNHDRVSKNRPVNEPGSESVSWVIYNVLQMLCNQAKLSNVKFIIPKKSYCVLDIFGFNTLYEHVTNKLDRKTAENKINDRQTQLKEIITFFRTAHWHEYAVFGRGRIIYNGTIIREDGYAEEHGYRGESGQAINCYIKSDQRSNPYYWGYLISTDHV